MGLCKLLFARWHHRVGVPLFERITLAIEQYILYSSQSKLLSYNIYLYEKYILNGNKRIHILNPLNELYRASLVSVQLQQLWKMTDDPTVG